MKYEHKMWCASISCWTVIILLAVFCVGCNSKPEGEIFTEGYVVSRDCGHCYDDDFLEVRLSIVQNPEESTGKWWEPANRWRSEDGLTKYLELEYFIRKEIDPMVQEGHYYIIRYREKDAYNRAIISARRPMKRNRKVQAQIANYGKLTFEAKVNETPDGDFKVEYYEKIPAPRVKPKEVSSSYFWPTSDLTAPEQIGTWRSWDRPTVAVNISRTRPVFLMNNFHYRRDVILRP